MALLALAAAGWALALAMARRSARLRRNLAAADAENAALCALVRRLVAPAPPAGQGHEEKVG